MLTVALLLQGAQSKTPSQEPVVIADGRWRESHIEEICQSPEEEAVAKLKELGYVLVKQNKDAFLIAPTLWQQDQMDRALKMYKHLNSSLRGEGTLDLSKDQALQQFVQSAFGNSGAEIAGDSTVAVGTHNSYQLGVGDHSVTIRGGSYSKFPNSKLAQHPVSRGDKHAAPEGAMEAYRPKYPSEYAVFGFRGTTVGGKERFQSLQEALGLIRQHLEAFDQAKAQARKALGDSVRGDDSHTIGLGFGGLPQEMQDDLRSSLTNDFAAYGFGSAGEAMDFLSHATLQGLDSGIMLTVSLGSYQGTPQFYGKELP